ncbi:MAG: hypothetical protein V2A62_00030 [Candidatus Woesearchaeota archaeon]
MVDNIDSYLQRFCTKFLEPVFEPIVKMGYESDFRNNLSGLAKYRGYAVHKEGELFPRPFVRQNPNGSLDVILGENILQLHFDEKRFTKFGVSYLQVKSKTELTELIEQYSDLYQQYQVATQSGAEVQELGDTRTYVKLRKYLGAAVGGVIGAGAAFGFLEGDIVRTATEVGVGGVGYFLGGYLAKHRISSMTGEHRKAMEEYDSKQRQLCAKYARRTLTGRDGLIKAFS